MWLTSHCNNKKQTAVGDSSEFETVASVQILKLIKNQTSVSKTLIDAAINKGLEYVKKCYKTVQSEGTTYAGFALNSSSQNPVPRETANGVWALLNPESDIWSRWFAP